MLLLQCCCPLGTSRGTSAEPFLDGSDLDYLDDAAKDDVFRSAKRIKSLGRGSSGVVELFRVTVGPNSRVVVRKRCTYDNIDAVSKDRLYAEVRFLASLSHPNITAYLHCLVDSTAVSIFMEHAEGGTLANAIQSRRGYAFETNQAVRWLAQLTAALQHVHSHELLHRDLKTQNVFLSAAAGGAPWGNVRLGDFGVARALSTYTNFSQTLIGTPACMAPEALASAPYSHPADVWGLGVILFEVLTLRRPFGQGDGLRAVVSRISRGQYDAPALESAPHPPGLKRLASHQGLLHPEPEERLRLDELVQELATLGYADALVSVHPPNFSRAAERDARVGESNDPSFYPGAAAAQIAALLREPADS